MSPVVFFEIEVSRAYVRESVSATGAKISIPCVSANLPGGNIPKLEVVGGIDVPEGWICRVACECRIVQQQVHYRNGGDAVKLFLDPVRIVKCQKVSQIKRDISFEGFFSGK